MSIGIVKTDIGLVEGIELSGINEGITEFRGIPFAKPPVGRLRWAPPEEIEPWEGVRVCDKYGPAAIQTLLGGKRAAEVYFMGTPELSEDCLYLNVITPASKPDEALPVYVWFHDGGLTNGFTHGIESSPLALVRQGIVVVQVAQRLGEFGYMALPQLTEEYGVSGNYGLMDSIMAMEWVFRNVSAFGGDASKISIGGQSGGTAKVCALVAVPQMKGKIRGVINQSGLKWQYLLKTQEEAEKAGVDFLRSMGIDPCLSLDELREIPAMEIHKNPNMYKVPGNMVLDGVYFKKQFSEALMDGIEGVNFINSLTEGEADVYGIADATVRKKPFSTAEEFYSHFKKLLGELYDKYDFKSLVSVTDESAWRTALRLASRGLAVRGHNNMSRNLMVDRIFGEMVAERYPKNRVYTYLFTHLLPKRTDVEPGDDAFDEILAPHASDLWYGYNSLAEGIPPVRPWRKSDYEMGNILNGYFANFIKTGDPNGEGLAEWPQSDENYAWLDMSTSPVAHSGIEDKLDELIQEFVIKTYDIK